MEQCRRNVAERLGLAPDQVLAVGIDRLDYTKGILERMHAVERLLERHEEWIGRFVFVQVAAPSRSSLENTVYSGTASGRRPSGSTSASAVRTINRSICWPSTTTTTRSPSCIALPTWAW